jgi:hypothetical protein
MPDEEWFVCAEEDCGAGPFRDKNRFMHWYDNAHLSYYLVSAPEDCVDRDWDAHPIREQHRADLDEQLGYYGPGMVWT